MNISLRCTNEDDLNFVMAIEAKEENKPFIAQWPFKQHLDSINRDDHSHLIFYNSETNTALAYAIIYDVSAFNYGFYIKRFAVELPSTGVGKAALKLLADHFAGKMLSLAVVETNSRAIHVYEKLNFKSQNLSPNERAYFVDKVDDIPENCIIMLAE